MKRITHIKLLAAIIMMVASGCSRGDGFVDTDNNTTESVVEVLADGRIKVSASIAATTQTPIETRATVSPDNIIYTGWCLVFGVDQTLYDVATATDGTQTVTDKSTGKQVDDGYGPNSPLLQKTKIIANTNGRFYMTFNTTTERCFMRIVANLSDREETSYEEAIAKADIPNGNNTTQPATFGQFIKQSIGLDGIYDFAYEGKTIIDYDPATGEGTGDVTYKPVNTLSPDPTKLQRAFPMSSYGYVLKNGISSETITDMFNQEIKMIRIFSKIVVYAKAGSNFIIDSVTLLNGANESRVRSTVLSSTADVAKPIELLRNMGGSVGYLPVGAVSSAESMPIYLYPNSGGNYLDADGNLNEGAKPTYIIIRGKADGYSDYGYYKVALKATYPLTSDDTGAPSPLTYDILRDNFFHINLEKIDKPGYATFEDAASDRNPANNISYSIVINGKDNRNEYLVSKGTYFVELESSRIYAKGYLGNSISGDINFTATPASDHYTPNIYIYGEGGVTILSVGTNNGAAADFTLNSATTKFVPSSASAQDVSITFAADSSGYICIRCGDILKRVPVIYEPKAVSMFGGKLEINDGNGNSWSDFSYDDIWYENRDAVDHIDLNEDGVITNANDQNYDSRGFVARIFPKDGSGFTQLYVRQASRVELFDIHNNKVLDNNSLVNLVYQSTGNIYSETINGDTTAVMDALIDVNDARTYQIKGESNNNQYATDCFITSVTDNKYSTVGWNQSNGTEFTLKAVDIGTNQYSNVAGEYNPKYGNDYVYYAAYKNENYKLTNNNSAVVTIYNGAGEGKTYTFGITQYARPYCSHGDEVCDAGIADRYGNNIGGAHHNRGMVTHSCAFYNCLYHEKNDYAGLFFYDWNPFNDTSGSFGVYHRTSHTPAGAHSFVYDSTVGSSSQVNWDNKTVYSTREMTLVNDVGETVYKEIKHGDHSYGLTSHKGTKTAYSGKY